VDRADCPHAEYLKENQVKQLVAIALTAVMLAGALAADRISHITGTGDNRRVEHLEDISVTSWSASQVQYRTAAGQTGSIQHRNIFSLTRAGGTMHRSLANAIELVGADPQRALTELGRIVESGNNLDKEEAGFWRLAVFADDAGSGAQALNRAITESQNYLRTYRAGYFARDVYRSLSQMQRRAGRPQDARATLRSMSEADNALQREANLWLGELEAGDGKWEDAVRAFQASKSAAQRDQNKSGQYLAQAWEGLSLLRRGDAAAARAALEPIVADSGFEDPFTGDADTAMAVAFMAMGDVHFEAGNLERAYNAYIRGAYHNFWIESPREGYCLAQAFACARRLEATDEKWRPRREHLRTALAVNYPRELQRVEQQR